MPNKARRVQTRRCASHNFIKPDDRVRRGTGSIEKCSATRKEKLSVHRVAKVVNRKWRQTLRKCEIKEINGFWCVLTATGDLLAQYTTLNDAINFAHSNA